jgi:hypothetical protein
LRWSTARCDQGQVRPLPCDGKRAKHKPLISSNDHTVVATFGAVYRRIVQLPPEPAETFRLSTALIAGDELVIALLRLRGPAVMRWALGLVFVWFVPPTSRT